MKLVRAAVVAAVVLAGAAASVSPADAHVRPVPVQFADVNGAWWCDGWLEVVFDVEEVGPHAVTALNDDGTASLRLRGHGGRFGPSGTGWVDADDTRFRDGWLHIRESSPQVQSILPDMVGVTYHGVTSVPRWIETGCPA